MENLTNYARNTAEATQTMMNVNNAAGEEQYQQMEKSTVQNQDLEPQLDIATT